MNQKIDTGASARAPRAVTTKREWAADLSTQRLYALLKLRVEVFVVEQAYFYPELDGEDLRSLTRHFWLERDDEVLCTLRLTEEGNGPDRVLRIGHLCTRRSERGKGHTTRLLQAALADVGSARCRIDSPSYLVDIYTGHGFVPCGDEVLDNGVPVIPLVRESK
ncbi:GNAT family N-acetyltransferase [Rhodococcus sp. PAMC28707]|uniref:GNAT family N-acetyltransferase n=1 Tax=unclassified Rhodococcus (in: high G+C Gram-positive bacteria) TaxID=192944 RepID=UPI00109E027F|nr:MULTISPECIES: GNAT family N-acetyltransferase [unclassified Rhodococcus (in: high G+C Gram-positive bacteria)]QCB50422.1 GNAT family N-acetyltransferase [Rhodococcus sp. PAMC28705]QCB57886.1 GNAT family N-acetyltransferase [Rhodococcus sp. PAMC28707]